MASFDESRPITAEHIYRFAQVGMHGAYTSGLYDILGGMTSPCVQTGVGKLGRSKVGLGKLGFGNFN